MSLQVQMLWVTAELQAGKVYESTESGRMQSWDWSAYIILRSSTGWTQRTLRLRSKSQDNVTRRFVEGIID